MSFQKIVVQGRVGKDPEVRTTGAGDPVASFSVAVDAWVKQGEDKRAEWFNVVCFKSKADVVSKYVHKGDLILVSGRLSTEKWTDKNGQERSTVKLYADELSLIGRTERNSQEEAPAKSAASKPAKAATKPAQEEVNFDDDIPF